jgi:hypothetical protein
LEFGGNFALSLITKRVFFANTVGGTYLEVPNNWSTKIVSILKKKVQSRPQSAERCGRERQLTGLRRTRDAVSAPLSARITKLFQKELRFARYNRALTTILSRRSVIKAT